jgi:hypothetical protein
MLRVLIGGHELIAFKVTWNILVGVVTKKRPSKTMGVGW